MNNTVKFSLAEKYAVQNSKGFKSKSLAENITPENNDTVEQPQHWEWEAPRIHTKLVERFSDAATLGAFTADVAIPLGLVAESAGMPAAVALLSIGAGLFRLTKGGLETSAGIKDKKIPYLASGILDLGLGVCTLTAGFGVLTMPSLFTAVGLLGMRTAYGEANGTALAAAFGKKAVKKISQSVHYLEEKFNNLFHKKTIS